MSIVGINGGNVKEIHLYVNNIKDTHLYIYIYTRIYLLMTV